LKNPDLGDVAGFRGLRWTVVERIRWTDMPEADSRA
jgi:hypothetical protein